MTPRQRKLRFGAAVALVLIGVGCGAAISGTIGNTLATAFIGLGLIGVVSLIFYEVGLSEDRDRARETRRAGKSAGAGEAGDVGKSGRADSASGRPPGPPGEDGSPARLRSWRPDRMRGQRRRLR